MDNPFGWSNVVLAILAALFAVGATAAFLSSGDLPSYDVRFVAPFHYNAMGADRLNLDDEYITLKNTGKEAIEMTGWTLSNEDGQVYTFPDGFSLDGGAKVTLFSGCGENTDEQLHWCTSEEVWDNDRFKAVLRADKGFIVDVNAFESKCKVCGS